MNPETLVTVHGYSGDQAQIRNSLRVHESHGCPVVIFSPEDSPITKMGPHICRAIGKRAYIGAPSLERQRLHLQAMLAYPFKYFLANDSDSVCLSPKLPDYLYQEPDVLWSNEVSDMMHHRAPSYPWPRLAFQPPYFMSRSVIEKLLDAADKNLFEPQTPFIDWVMMAWAIESGCPHKNFRDGASYPTRNYSEGFNVMRRAVRVDGKIFVHSIKDKRVLDALINDRHSHIKQLKRINVNIPRRR